MTRSMLGVSLIASVSKASEGLIPRLADGAWPADDSGPHRFSRRPPGLGVLLALVACGLLVVTSWSFVKTGSDQVSSAAGANCGLSGCSVNTMTWKPALPPEWRYEKKAYEFDHMFREAPGTSRVVAGEALRR